MRDTLPLLLKTEFPTIGRRKLDTLQANLGYRCNQSCLHCHVAASPKRVADHCYGCTAGQGSSCGGALEHADAAQVQRALASL